MNVNILVALTIVGGAQRKNRTRKPLLISKQGLGPLETLKHSKNINEEFITVFFRCDLNMCQQKHCLNISIISRSKEWSI